VNLADSVRDPLIRSSFFYQISFGYSLTGYYKAGLEFVGRGEDEVRMQRLSFAQTHLAAARIAATIGLRRFKKAQSLVDGLADLASAVDDSFEFANSRALQARLLICAGDEEGAAAALREWEATPVAALTAELAGLRALALAKSARPESEQLSQLAIRMSGNAQAHTVAHAARAIVDLRAGIDPGRSRLVDFEDVLLDRQNYDALVLAYRSYPPVLAALADRGRIPQRRLLRLITEAQDAAIATAVGIGVPNPRKTETSLSSREQEVFDLMQRGRKNKEIAATLFISEATVKVHVRHILEKLNARSRTEAVARYQDT
jgi:DNA-binding CsgD family transcriptional regulator